MLNACPDKAFGMVNWSFFIQGKTSKRLRPRPKRDSEMIKSSTKVMLGVSVKADPSAPMSPPRKKKDMSRPKWKRICGHFLLPIFAKLADRESAIPPTVAIQLEKDATTPIRQTVP